MYPGSCNLFFGIKGNQHSNTTTTTSTAPHSYKKVQTQYTNPCMSARKLRMHENYIDLSWPVNLNVSSCTIHERSSVKDMPREVYFVLLSFEIFMVEFSLPNQLKRKKEKSS